MSWTSANQRLQVELTRSYIYASENSVEIFLPGWLGHFQRIVCSPLDSVDGRAPTMHERIPLS